MYFFFFGSFFFVLLMWIAVDYLCRPVCRLLPGDAPHSRCIIVLFGPKKIIFSI